MPEATQKKPRRLDDLFTPEDRAKMARRVEQEESNVKVDDYWLLVAEFGELYGWPAVKDVLEDDIGTELLEVMVAAGRKIEARKRYGLASAVFTAVVAANDPKNPGAAFKKYTQNYLREMRADA